MKSFKILIAAAALAVFFTACEKQEVFTGIDSSKAGITDFTYDETMSSATSVSLIWNPDKALAAGATSISVQLAHNEDFSDATMYKPEVSMYANTPQGITIQADATVTDGCIFNGLKENDRYYARIRANYPRSIYSEWTLLQEDGGLACISVGHGILAMVFAAPKQVDLEVASEGKMRASWSVVGLAEGYAFQWKESAGSTWSEEEETTGSSAIISGLKAETSYDVRVRSYRGSGDSKEYSDYTTASMTMPKSEYKMLSSKNDLVEFFASVAAAAKGSDIFKMSADIDLGGEQIVGADSFAGVFDGQGFAIKGVKSSTPLFGVLNGTVQNVVIDASCKFTPTVSTFGVIASDNKGSISDITNKADVLYEVESISEPILIAGIVGQSSGSLSNCVNEGAVKVAASGSAVGLGVAGVVGFLNAPASKLTNKGTVTFSAKNIASKSEMCGAGKNVLPTPGGIVAIGAEGFALENCNNHGRIVFNVFGADTDLTANLNRNQIGGIVGAPCGNVVKCNNYGDIEVSVKNSSPGTALGYEYIVCVGGIGGGDYLFTSTSGVISNTNYTECTNEGNIHVNSDASKSNSAIGGIVGWPGQEKPTDTVTKGCLNKGNIFAEGAMKCRLGGIQGGSGVMDGCTNEGTITLSVTNTACAIGSLCGFHSQGHAITNCVAKGEVTATVQATGGVGGLIGNIGNVAHTTATGCEVHCKITSLDTAGETTGLVVGYFNGTSQAITLGTPEDPIKVSGSVNGAPASASNIRGSKNATDIHVINYAIK